MDATRTRTALRRKKPLKRDKPPKRRQKGLKRSRRPRTDEEIATLARYRLKNPDCELCLADGVIRLAAQTHHIKGGHGQRVHRRWNLFTACLDHHAAFEARKKYWTPILIAIKQAKGEWDEAEAVRISHGQKEFEDA